MVLFLEVCVATRPPALGWVTGEPSGPGDGMYRRETGRPSQTTLCRRSRQATAWSALAKDHRPVTTRRNESATALARDGMKAWCSLRETLAASLAASAKRTLRRALRQMPPAIATALAMAAAAPAAANAAAAAAAAPAAAVAAAVAADAAAAMAQMPRSTMSPLGCNARSPALCPAESACVCPADAGRNMGPPRDIGNKDGVVPAAGIDAWLPGPIVAAPSQWSIGATCIA
eukprot:CAMPEP_0117549496 /NCGR_PEP_ID=MMETSP0784-20121206/48194_1 /TAXON_ID=39447 /ORGANISM="" /LENGTH=230 /DNA_ID=CAMNT_0005346483 /DNA_START=165 /DNA_END=854 /DNA_ORIENTATION=-